MKKAAFATILTLLAGTAAANDTMAELKTGGLAFITTQDISMESEHLTISPEFVDVQYRFHNSADHDIEALVAFPMPDITGSVDFMTAVPDDAADNFLDFTVTQDGVAIEPNLQQQAIVEGVDFTNLLKEHAVPLTPVANKTMDVLEALPKDVLDEWALLGLIYIDEFDAGNGWERHPKPLWTLKSVYWWKAKYPAGADTSVHHRYRTSLGETVSVTYLDDGKPQGERYDDYVKRYCIDESFVRVAQKNREAEMNGMPLYTEAWISYILTTGANWSGPIKSFTLTLDKGDPKNLISFCGDGVKKTGPTTFEMHLTDFYPQKDLDILLLKRFNP
ncbi:DUF4424 domain-containing protein [Rhizobium sp. L1K21]|uniref:DUF4424 domain-containing protein n=1 Tax=Rhizobium sp. L1K21 TaxID=2954933 RepID=UPI002091EDB1|nr:DUF4424 domain-containing protein [Rhizobium sp. L1K21]MCO6186876.1 DUF4424 domain-containing protein [Rhizobium sp. L1K21]